MTHASDEAQCLHNSVHHNRHNVQQQYGTVPSEATNTHNHLLRAAAETADAAAAATALPAAGGDNAPQSLAAPPTHAGCCGCGTERAAAGSPSGAASNGCGGGGGGSKRSSPGCSPKCGGDGARCGGFARRALFGDSKRRRIDKFYAKQCNLMESFEQDSKQIQNFQQRRALQSQSSTETRHPSAEQFPPADLVVENGAGGGDADSMFEADTTGDRLLTTTKSGSTLKSASNGTILPPQPHLRILRSESSASTAGGHARSKLARTARRLALFTLLVNLTLTIAKALASYWSGSLSIISSLVDSLVDITSGLVIWMTGRAIKKHDPYLYPVGRTRLEPVALVIVSVIMAVASVQMIVQSLEAVVQQKLHPRVDWPTVGIMVTTVAVKMCLFFMCNRLKNDPSSRVLAQDHRNDCLSNSIALLCAIGAHKFWLYLDPIGAILVALYIAITWYRTGKEHLIMLSGRSAKPEFINRIIKVCIDHDSRIQFIDTVYVYHFGTRFLVEVHIVLDEDMRLKEAHDIAESLQNSIEALPDVERAFLHVDYEFEHKPQDEHKVP